MPWIAIFFCILDIVTTPTQPQLNCRNLVKVRWFFDGWLSKNVKEENNIGIEEFRKDLMEDGI